MGFQVERAKAGAARKVLDREGERGSDAASLRFGRHVELL